MPGGQWFMFGCPFIALDDTKATVNDLLPSGFVDGDRLYLYNNAEGQYFPQTLEWRTVDNVSAWRVGTNDDTIATNVIDPGDGAFIKKKTTSTVTVSGAVSASIVSSFGSEEGQNWSMVTVCYPTATTIDKIQWTEANLEDGDRLYLYNNEKGEYYPQTLAWRTVGETAAWRAGTNDDTIATNEVRPGDAFFIQKRSKGTGVFKK